MTTTDPRETARLQRRRAGFRRGHRAEALAAFALRLKGYRILAVRHRTRLGEIDLVARRGGTVAIVEVKARASIEAAVAAVTPTAQRRIEAAADLWLARQRDHAELSLRFDIMAVRPWRWPVHLPGAW